MLPALRLHVGVGEVAVTGAQNFRLAGDRRGDEFVIVRIVRYNGHRRVRRHHQQNGGLQVQHARTEARKRLP